MERWKQIPGYPEYFLISDQGRVKRLSRSYNRVWKDGSIKTSSLPEAFLIGNKLTKKGYRRVNLGKGPKLVHRLVAAAFIENPHDKPDVNHVNGIKTDNRVANLEWVTNYENRQHGVKLGLCTGPLRPQVNRKLLPEHYPYINDLIKLGCRQIDVAKALGLCQQTISLFLNKHKTNF